jgi:proteasome beta subunit
MTTTIGIIYNEGIILATEKRATMGHFIASQDAQKIHQLDHNIGLTMAGSVGDAQKLIKWMRFESATYKHQHGTSITIKGISNVLANILNNAKSFEVSMVIGGVDKTGYKLYSLDAYGGLIEEEKFVSTGSGSLMAYGVLEDNYKDGITMNNGLKLVVRALQTAMKRDAASGGKVNAMRITKNGCEIINESEINKIMEKL